MSNPEDQRQDPAAPRAPQDRGYYGAGWSTAPSQQPGPYAAQQGLPGAYPAQPNPYGDQPDPYGDRPDPAGDRPGPYGARPGLPGAQQYGPSAPGARYAPPARSPRPVADPVGAFAPGVAAAHVVSAAIAVVALLAIRLVVALTFLLGDVAIASTAPGDQTISPLSLFGSQFGQEFPFFAGAFASLVFLTPILRRSPLPTVLLRAVLAGAAGTVVTAIVGVFTAVVHSSTEGDASYYVTDVVSTPLANGLQDTAMLLATATAAWLWLGRPRRAPRPTTTFGMPGTVRPADAFPPATVPQQPVPPQAAPQQQPVPPQAAPPQQSMPPQHQPGPQQQPVPPQPMPQQPARQQSAQQQPAPIPPMPRGDDGPYGPNGAPRAEPPAPQNWSATAPSARGDEQDGR